MTSDLKILRYWFTMNNLSMNVSKTCYINFNIKQPVEFTIPIQYHKLTCDTVGCTCDVIEQVDNRPTKYLGVVIDSRVGWREHVSKIEKDNSHLIRKFYHLRNVCPDAILRMLYHALFECRAMYGIACWGGTYFSTIRPVVLLQKYILQIITRTRKRDHSYPLFQQLSILPLRQMYVYRVMRIYYTRSGNMTVYNTKYTTRYQLDGHADVPRPFKEIFQKFYLYLAPFLYNKLPITLRTSFQTGNLKKFLKNLEIWLLERPTVKIESWFNFRL